MAHRIYAVKIEASRLVSIGTLCTRMRFLLSLFASEQAFRHGRDWPDAVANLLYPAACVSHVETDAFAADLYQSGSYCEPAAEYDECQNKVLDDYMFALARFHFVWNAYETVRKTSEAGRLLISGSPRSRETLVERIPSMHQQLVEQAYHMSMSLVGTEETILRRLKNGTEVLNLGEAGLLAAGFRDYMFHGREDPPTPDDWDDQFGNTTDGKGVVSLQSYRATSFTRLTLHLIQALTHAELQPQAAVEAGDVLFLPRGDDIEFDVPCRFLVNLASVWPEELERGLPQEIIEECGTDCGLSKDILSSIMDTYNEAAPWSSVELL